MQKKKIQKKIRQKKGKKETKLSTLSLSFTHSLEMAANETSEEMRDVEGVVGTSSSVSSLAKAGASSAAAAAAVVQETTSTPLAFSSGWCAQTMENNQITGTVGMHAYFNLIGVQLL